LDLFFGFFIDTSETLSKRQPRSARFLNLKEEIMRFFGFFFQNQTEAGLGKKLDTPLCRLPGSPALIAQINGGIY